MNTRHRRKRLYPAEEQSKRGQSPRPDGRGLLREEQGQLVD